MGRLQKQLHRPDLIVLDELVYAPSTKTRAALFFEVVSCACDRTIWTAATNLPYENLTQVLGSGQLTTALLNRVSHRVHNLEPDRRSLGLR